MKKLTAFPLFELWIKINQFAPIVPPSFGLFNNLDQSIYPDSNIISNTFNDNKSPSKTNSLMSFKSSEILQLSYFTRTPLKMCIDGSNSNGIEEY